jgi:hypothetical protein
MDLSRVGGEQDVGLFDRFHSGPSEGDDETILKSSPEPFDPPLRLGRPCRDIASSESLQSAAELGYRRRVLQLLLDRQFFRLGRKEDGVAVGVKLARHAVAIKHLTEHAEVAEEALIPGHPQTEDLSCGIVNHAVESATLTDLEPIERRGVHLDQIASSGPSDPAGTPLRGPVAMNEGQVLRAKETGDALGAQHEIMLFGKEFGHVLTARIPVKTLGQTDDEIPCLLRDSAPGRFASSLVQEPLRSFFPVASFEPKDLTAAQTEPIGHLLNRQVARDSLFHQPQAPCFFCLHE